MSSNNCNCEELDQLRRDLAIECKDKLKAQAEVEALRTERELLIKLCGDLDKSHRSVTQADRQEGK